MRNLLFFLILICISFNSKGQKINWITFEEAIALNKKKPKNILIDVYTDWCGYCKKMDRKTYNNVVIAEIINTNFYAVKINAEQKKSIFYKGKEYKFIANGRKGYNEFALNLLHGKMSYPSTVFMDTNERIIQNVPGYLEPREIEPILIYFGQDKYLKDSWKVFKTTFKSNL